VDEGGGLGKDFEVFMFMPFGKVELVVVTVVGGSQKICSILRSRVILADGLTRCFD